MQKKEIAFIAGMVILCLIMLLIRLKKEKLIDQDKAYVIGIVVEKDWLENGFSYKCKYHYDDQAYFAEFTDIRPSNDSLVFLKISREYPSKWKLIESTHVPKCFKISDSPKYGWSNLPTCDSLK